MNVWLARRGKFMTLALLAALLVQLWAPARAWGEGACPGPSDEFAGGDGSEECPYLIATPDHLNNVRNYYYDQNKNFKLIADIDLAESAYKDNWVPIDDFNGKFDGDGHKIRNLTIDRNRDYVGLFGSVNNDAEIRNLGLEDVNVRGSNYVGALAGNIGAPLSMFTPRVL